MELGHLQWVFSQSASKHVIFQASLDYGVKTLSQQNTHTINKTYSKTNVSTEQREHKTESKKKNQQFQRAEQKASSSSEASLKENHPVRLQRAETRADAEGSHRVIGII